MVFPGGDFKHMSAMKKKGPKRLVVFLGGMTLDPTQ